MIEIYLSSFSTRQKRRKKIFKLKRHTKKTAVPKRHDRNLTIKQIISWRTEELCAPF